MNDHLYNPFIEDYGSWVLGSSISILFAYTTGFIFGTFQRLVKDIAIDLFIKQYIYKTICLRKTLSLRAITVERYVHVVLDAVAFYSYQLDIIALHK